MNPSVQVTTTIPQPTSGYITPEMFQTFVNKAKLACYANPSAKAEQLYDGRERMTYRDGGLSYEDKWMYDKKAGFFIGTEIASLNDKVRYMMNYSGELLNRQTMDDEMTWAFLKESLRNAPGGTPARGPQDYRAQGDLLYLIYNSNFAEERKKDIVLVTDGTEQIFPANFPRMPLYKGSFSGWMR